MSNEIEILLANEFNNAIKDLADKAASKKNKDMIGYRQQLFLLIRSSPLQLIEKSATMIWKYRRVIAGIKQNNVYNWDLIDELKPSIDEHEDVNKSIIDLLYTLFMEASDDEKIDVYNNVLSILSIVKRYRDVQKSKNS